MTTLIILVFSLLAKRSVGSVVDDRQNQIEPTVSGCIRWKWEFWVSLFDIDKNGVIAADDLKNARKIFFQLHELTGEEKKRREEKFTLWWTEMILWNKKEITVNEFVDLQSSAFLDDKENFVEKMRKMTELIEHCLDVDNNGYISKEEETIFLKTIGLTDEKQDNDFFKGLHPEVKGVPVSAMSNYWVRYLTEDDCSNTETDDPMNQLSESS